MTMPRIEIEVVGDYRIDIHLTTKFEKLLCTVTEKTFGHEQITVFVAEYAVLEMLSTCEIKLTRTEAIIEVLDRIGLYLIEHKEI